MKRIAIICQTSSHLINLVKYLDARDEYDVTYYTIMPQRRCAEKYGYNGKVVSFMFPLGLVYGFIVKAPGFTSYQRSHMHFFLRKAFDRLCTIFLHKCDIFISANGTGIKASEKAKRKYGAITICDQGSSHILSQNAAHYTYSNIPIPDYSTNYMLEHYKVSDYMMAPSVYVKETDINNGIPSEKILYNPYGVDEDRFKLTYKPDNESYDVIMTGSWWKHKGCDMLAKACIDILNVKLLHVGAVIDCEIPDSPLFSHIDFVPESDLPKYYAKSKVFAFPSLDEGFGLVVLQAAACGLPIVSSRNGGGRDVKELLDDTNSIFIIDGNLTTETIADKISEALQYHESLHEGKRDQCESHLQNITWEAYGHRWSEIINKISIGK